MPRYFIKRPGPNRKTFALVGPDNKTIPDERIDRVNVLLAAGIAMDLLEARMREIRDGFKHVSGLKMQSLENERLAKEYIEQGLLLKKRRAPEAFRNEIMRAVRALGNINLQTAERAQLQTCLDNKFAGRPAIQRRTVQAVNQLLRYADRTLRLAKEEMPIPDVKYITFPTLLNGLKDLPEDYRNLFAAAFATGARFGELFAITNFENQMVGIRMQWKVKAKRVIKNAPPKGNRARDAFVVPELAAYVTNWIATPEAVKESLRLKYSDPAKLANKVYGVNFHALRHSYAIHLAGKGFSKADMAENLGNTEHVVRLHYNDFIKTKEQAFRYARLYKKG